jgi:hypothetical protein
VKQGLFQGLSHVSNGMFGLAKRLRPSSHVDFKGIANDNMSVTAPTHYHFSSSITCSIFNEMATSFNYEHGFRGSALVIPDSSFLYFYLCVKCMPSKLYEGNVIKICISCLCD